VQAHESPVQRGIVRPHSALQPSSRLQRLEVFLQIVTLFVGELKVEHLHVMVHHIPNVFALPSWKYGGCFARPRSGVVRYFF
jgi:hypothetical protein